MNASEFGCGAGHQLAITAAKAGWELEDFSVLQKSEKKCRQVLQFLRGEADLVPKAKPALEPEPEINTLIRINRALKPAYPDWVKEVIHPELEGVGPAEYDLTKVELRLHDDQKDGSYTTGHKIYEHLKATDSLKNCFGLDDALAIQKNGIAAFRKAFGNKVVVCWRSVVRFQNGDLGVPYVYDGGDRVVGALGLARQRLRRRQPGWLFRTVDLRTLDTGTLLFLCPLFGENFDGILTRQRMSCPNIQPCTAMCGV